MEKKKCPQPTKIKTIGDLGWGIFYLFLCVSIGNYVISRAPVKKNDSVHLKFNLSVKNKIPQFYKKQTDVLTVYLIYMWSEWLQEK